MSKDWSHRYALYWVEFASLWLGGLMLAWSLILCRQGGVVNILRRGWRFEKGQGDTRLAS
jgi:hypothetical protein